MCDFLSASSSSDLWERYYRFYKICVNDLDPVLDTLKYIKKQTNGWLEVTTLLVSDHNDTEQELNEMAQWVVEQLGRDVSMHFTAFHPECKMIDTPFTPPETLLRARAIALKNGERYAYTGNVFDEFGESTYCHECRTRLIGSNCYAFSDWNLVEEAM